eukprot:1575802-Ditylum_brightwellii.AAC.1
MGLYNSPDIFQEKMSKMLADIKEVCAYIDNLLLITNGGWGNHLEKLDKVLDRLKYAGLKVNAQTSFFRCQELGDTKPLQKKAEAVLKIAPPTTRKQLCSFICMINYYCKMWQGHSKVLVPLAMLTTKVTQWKWMSVEQRPLNKLRK